MAKRKRSNFPVPQPQRPSPETRSQYLQITYEAPLPPPHMLAEYERILPGVSDRLVKRMEAQSVHRQALEKTKLTSDIASEKRGQFLAFILAAMAILGAFYLIATGKDRYGIYIFITTFASLVTVFIVGKVKQTRELARKRKEMKEMLPKPPESHQ